MVEFKEKDLLGGWSIAVMQNGITLGHIRKHGYDGSFVYYKWPDNQLNWSLQDQQLDGLKAKIVTSLK